MLPKSVRITILIATAAVALFCALGVWQLDRASQKRQRHAEFLRSADTAPSPLAALAPGAATRWRQAMVDGHYTAQRLLLDNQLRHGVVGYDVFGVFLPDEGPALLVNRGWIQAGEQRSSLPRIKMPLDHRRLAGRLAPPPSTGIRLGAAASAAESLGPDYWRVQHLEPEVLEQVLGRPLRPDILLLDPAEPDGFERSWVLPEADDGKHTAYALQWFSFAAIAFLLAARSVRRSKQ